ncbi:hypothetical protein FRC09_015753 [Ceratobasidium sp. 395]|nr:hypothetical protein FRC09_015753 [Ceratobasidium sp. 395]
MWLPIGRPFESKHRALLAYRFGSPHPQEISDGLKAWLKYAKKDGSDESGEEKMTKVVRGVTSANSVSPNPPRVSPPTDPSATVNTPVNAAPSTSPPPAAQIASAEGAAALDENHTGDNGGSAPENPGSELPRASSDNAGLGATLSDAAADTTPNAAADATSNAATNAATDAAVDVAAGVTVPVTSPPDQGASRASKKSKATKVAATPRLTRNNAAAAAAAATATATGSAASVSSRTRHANTKATGANTSKKGTKHK